MKWLKIIPILILMGCSYTLYRINKYGSVEHQCRLPARLVADKTLTPGEELCLINGVSFWNHYRPGLLIYDGRHEALSTDVNVGHLFPPNSKEDFFATVHIVSGSGGCIKRSYINILTALDDLPHSVGNLIMIHELGHVLGLDDQPCDGGKIMCGNIPSDGKNIALYPSKDELEALYEMYDEK